MFACEREGLGTRLLLPNLNKLLAWASHLTWSVCDLYVQKVYHYITSVQYIHELFTGQGFLCYLMAHAL